MVVCPDTSVRSNEAMAQVSQIILAIMSSELKLPESHEKLSDETAGLKLKLGLQTECTTNVKLLKWQRRRYISLAGRVLPGFVPSMTRAAISKPATGVRPRMNMVSSSWKRFQNQDLQPLPSSAVPMSKLSMM